MSRTTPHVLTVALATIAMLTTAPATSAAPPQREVIVEEFSDNFDDFCDVPGLDVHQAGVVTVRSARRIRGGQNGLLYFADHVKVTSTITNRDTDDFVTTLEKSLSKDLRVTDNGDGTLTIDVLATGNFTIFGQNGKAIARNPGQFRFRVVIDHNGTPNNPDDDTEISFEVLKESTGRTDDFCTAVVAAIG